MNSTETLDTTFWESKLGLLPIKLFHSPKDTNQQQFIMLNGMSNNFCLDLDPASSFSKNEYFSHAWSCDVGSFVKITEDKVQIYNWGKPEKFEVYDRKVVFERLDSFYKYLGEKQIPKENSIVPFATNIFRSLRNEFGESGKSEISLKAFLYMLAFIDNNEKEITDFKSLGLDGIDNQILSSLSPYIKDFKNGIGYYDLKPNMSLILRHVSGKLFQESHYLATLDRQRTLWGTASAAKNIQPEKYGTVHFTPSFVARSIVEEVLDAFIEFPTTLKILDPAMGSGEFLKEVLRQLKNRGYKGTITVVGWDVSKPAIDMAKFVLAFEQKEWNENQVNIDLKVVDNSLTEEWDNDYNIILMNPPFLSWEHLNENERFIMREVLENNYQKNPNLASAFFWKATKSLIKDGVLGCVMPTTILNADSYKILRTSVEDYITPRLIAKLGNYIFQNAFTDACFYVGQKSKQIHNTKIIWTYNTVNSATDALRTSRKIRFSSKSTIIDKEDYSVYYADVPKENWTPISYKGVTLLSKLSKAIEKEQLKKVKTLFEIRQGVTTGNDCFITDDIFYHQLSKSERKFFRPAVQSKAITNGKLKVVNYCFYPSTIGLELIENEEHLSNIVTKFYFDKLIPNKKKLTERPRKSENNWWSLNEDRAWQRNPNPKLVSAAFGKAGSFAFDKLGIFVVERGYAWIPKNGNRFSEDTYYAYLSIFCSDFFNDLLGIYSKQIASGWYLAKQFVDNIPIPDLTIPNSFTSEEFSKLNIIGRKLSEGIEIDRIALNETVKIIYDLP